MALLDPHKTEISALNAIVQLLGGGGGSGTNQDIVDAVTALNNDINSQNTGTFQPGAIDITFSGGTATIPGGVYTSYTIFVKSGTISIGDATEDYPTGASISFGDNSNKTALPLVLTEVTAPAVVILSTEIQ